MQVLAPGIGVGMNSVTVVLAGLALWALVSGEVGASIGFGFLAVVSWGLS